MDEAAIRSRLGAARSAVLATIDGEGRPHVVPIVFAMVDDETLVSAVDHKPKTTQRLKRIDNVAAHPEVSVLVHHYQEDWTQLWWIRVDGTAAVITEEPERTELIARLVGKYDHYTEQPPEGPAIRVTVTGVRSWEATPHRGT